MAVFLCLGDNFRKIGILQVISNVTRKIAGLQAFFSSSCRGLQPLAAPVEPFRPKIGVLRAKSRMLKIHLDNLAEIHLQATH